MKTIVLQDYGGYRFIFNLARELSRNNKVIYIFNSSSGGANTNYVSEHNLEVVDLGIKKHFKNNLLIRKRREAKYGRNVVNYLKNTRIDLLISTNTPLDAQKIISENLFYLNHVIWVQDLLSVAIKTILNKKNKIFGSLIGSYYNRIEKKCYENASRLITISDQLKEEILKWGITNTIEVLPNWAPVEEIKVLSKKNSFSEAHNLDNKFVVLYSGSLGMKHDPNLILDASKRLLNYDDIILLIISEGLGAKYIKEQKRINKLNNLIILNFQPNEIYQQVLATADINLILLNKDAQNYSVPSKAWSAMCSGRPLLTNIGMHNQVSKIINKTNSGIVLSSNQSVACGIIEFFNNPNIRMEMGKNARKYAETNFKISKIAHKFIKKAGFIDL